MPTPKIYSNFATRLKNCKWCFGLTFIIGIGISTGSILLGDRKLLANPPPLFFVGFLTLFWSWGLLCMVWWFEPESVKRMIYRTSRIPFVGQALIRIIPLSQWFSAIFLDVLFVAPAVGVLLTMTASI